MPPRTNAFGATYFGGDSPPERSGTIEREADLPRGLPERRVRRLPAPRLVAALLAGAVLFPANASPLRGQAASCPPRLALVLSGGGAKGFAHVGVIQALDSLGIRPDLVVGTSMGALIGALYASGMSGTAIDSLVGRIPLEQMFHRGRTPSASRLGALIETVEWLDPLLVWERRERSLQLRSPAVDEDAVNALLTRVLLPGNLQAAGDFDRLPIPFRAVATDLRNRRSVVLGEGDLAQAVRASIAIPGVFTPVVIDGRPLVDGGFSQNVPMRPARALGAQRLLISDVIERPTEAVQTGNAVAVIDQVLDLLMHDEADSLAPGDIEVRPVTTGVGILDFTPGAAARLVGIGRTAATDTLRRMRGLPGAPVCREEPPGPVPEPELVDELRERLGALAPLAPEAVWLHPRRSDDSLTFAAVAQLPAPGRVAAGLGYDNQAGGHAWIASEDVGLLKGHISAAALVFLGELRRSATLRLGGSGLRRPALEHQGNVEMLPDPRSGRPPWRRRTGVWARPGIVVHALEEDVRHFDDAGHVTGTTLYRDALGYLGAEIGGSSSWYAATGPVALTWSGRDSTWSAPPAASRAVGWFARGGWLLGPSAASDELTAADGAIAEALWTTGYHRVLLSAGGPGRIGTVALHARALAGWGERLPVGQTFLLGGREGFPGFVIGERRGDRVVGVGLTGTRWVQGPVYARAELAVGASAHGGPVVPARDWNSGAGLGLLVSTPLGSASVSYGWNTAGRGALLVQVGGP